MPTWRELLPWVNNGARTQEDLQNACQNLGLNTEGELGQLRDRLRAHIAAQDLGAQATWAPPGWVVPATPPEQPEPARAPATAAPTELGQTPAPQRGGNWLRELLFTIAGGVVTVLLLGLVMLFAPQLRSAVIGQPSGQPTATATAQATPTTVATSVATQATATPTAQPAPTVTPTAQPSSAGQVQNCLDTAKASEWAKSATSVGQLIQRLNEAWDLSGGSIGEGWLTGPFNITNPGSGGASLVWTDSLHQPWIILTSGQDVRKNVFRVRTIQGGDWGTFIVFTAVRVPTPGRSARLCQAVDLSRDFPGATPVQ